MREIATAAILLAAAGSDLTKGKIPNGLILLGYLMGGYLAFCEPIWSEGGLQNLNMSAWLKALLPLVIFYPFFLLRLMGAGDIKLLSVLALLLPVDCWFSFLACSFLVAGGMLIIRSHGSAGEFYGSGTKRIPLAGCFLIGQLLMLAGRELCL